jgi:hypothetical protein
MVVVNFGLMGPSSRLGSFTADTTLAAWSPSSLMENVFCDTDFFCGLRKLAVLGLKLLTRGPMPIFVHETAHMENVVAGPTAWIMG